MKTISDCSCCRFIDNTTYIKTCNTTCISSCLALRIIKVSWHCDNCIDTLCAKIGFGDFFHITKNHRRYLFRRDTFCLTTIFNTKHWFVE
mmetsp:Transcript_16686/g.24915  ORF Transcript_16686/g.24915 Transcript_16686/m.24915 type:complete len:90 (-) Transcript_16686:307-576(-)